MNKQLLHYIAVAYTSAILFCSCQKDLKNENADTGLRGTPLPGQQTYCRIESIWENPNEIDQRYILFLYDEYENPTVITTPHITTDGPYHTFKYDSWHRLREYKGDAGHNNFEFWHFYGYDNNGRINVDTNYTLGAIGPHGELSAVSRWIKQLEYDSQNRISKEVVDVEPGPYYENYYHYHYENTYNYDAAGNLIFPASDHVTYDNKLSIYRTNDIWMFLHRDYSVNNRVVATEYNSSGYPTKVNSPKGFSPANFYFLNAATLDHSQISYGCRQAYW
jgi:hypothetical protein